MGAGRPPRRQHPRRRRGRGRRRRRCCQGGGTQRPVVRPPCRPRHRRRPAGLGRQRPVRRHSGDPGADEAAAVRNRRHRDGHRGRAPSKAATGPPATSTPDLVLAYGAARAAGATDNGAGLLDRITDSQRYQRIRTAVSAIPGGLAARAAAVALVATVGGLVAYTLIGTPGSGSRRARQHRRRGGAAGPACRRFPVAPDRRSARTRRPAPAADGPGRSRRHRSPSPPGSPDGRDPGEVPRGGPRCPSWPLRSTSRSLPPRQPSAAVLGTNPVCAAARLGHRCATPVRARDRWPVPSRPRLPSAAPSPARAACPGRSVGRVVPRAALTPVELLMPDGRSAGMLGT